MHSSEPDAETAPLHSTITFKSDHNPAGGVEAENDQEALRLVTHNDTCHGSFDSTDKIFPLRVQAFILLLIDPWFAFNIAATQNHNFILDLYF